MLLIFIQNIIIFNINLKSINLIKMRLIYNMLRISSSKIKKTIFYFNKNNTDIFRSKLYKFIHRVRNFYTKLDQLHYRSKTLKSPLNGGNNLWQQYKLEFTSIPRHSIINNLQLINPDFNDIVIVPTIYLKYLKRNLRQIFSILYLCR